MAYSTKGTITRCAYITSDACNVLQYRLFLQYGTACLSTVGPKNVLILSCRIGRNIHEWLLTLCDYLCWKQTAKKQ